MAITTMSPTGDDAALDWYITNHAPKDAGERDGFGRRVEFVSTIGNCTAPTFVADVARNQEAHRKTGLKYTTWHMVISWSHEEADPYDEVAGAERHRVGMEIARRDFPGRQIKATTQRDNGRWEGEGADRHWVPGKWHTHFEIAHVSERAATVPCSVKGPDGKHRTVMRRVPAGRALNGTTRDIARLRAITDEVVLEKLGYDNAAYVKSCRPLAEVTREDVAQRAVKGYSSYDQLRERLDAAVASSRTWDEYIAHAALDSIDVKTHGAKGASYAWRDDAGTEHKARARKLGNAYTRAGVEERQLGHGGHAAAASSRTKAINDAQAARHPEYAGPTYEDRIRERLDALVDDPAVRSRVDLAVGMAERGVALGGDEAVVMTPQGRVACAPEHLGGEYTLVRVMGRSEREKEKERINDNRSNDRGDTRGGSESSTVAAERARRSAERLRALEHTQRILDDAERDERSASADRGTGHDRRAVARDGGTDGRSSGAGAQHDSLLGQDAQRGPRRPARDAVGELAREAARRRAEPGRGRDGDHGYGD